MDLNNVKLESIFIYLTNNELNILLNEILEFERTGIVPSGLSRMARDIHQLYPYYEYAILNTRLIPDWLRKEAAMRWQESIKNVIGE